MKRSYYVTYTFGASIRVEAESEAEAESIVEDMETRELLDLAADGFEIVGATEEEQHGTS